MAFALAAPAPIRHDIPQTNKTNAIGNENGKAMETALTAPWAKAVRASINEASFANKSVAGTVAIPLRIIRFPNRIYLA